MSALLRESDWRRLIVDQSEPKERIHGSISSSEFPGARPIVWPVKNHRENHVRLETEHRQSHSSSLRGLHVNRLFSP